MKAKGYRIVAGDITSPIQKTIPSISKDTKKVQSDTRGFHKVAVVQTCPEMLKFILSGRVYVLHLAEDTDEIA